jgi:hypothetical protein
MRKAAGIILIVSGALGLIGLVRFLAGLVSTLSFVSAVPTILLEIAPIAFFIIGGAFCLGRKHWRVCLASASLAASIGIFLLVTLSLGRAILLGRGWISWIGVLAAIISVIFISLSRREWQGIPDTVDSKASDGS